MPYQWTTINVPLAVGINTRDDEKLVPLSRLLDLQNSIFEKGGALTKRNGYRELSGLSSAKALMVRQDELIAADGRSLYSYSETLRQWVEHSSLVNFGTSVETIADTNAAQTVADCAETGGLRVFAWEDSRGGVWYSGYDAETGAEVLAQRQLSSTAQTPRVVAIDDTIHIVYHDTATLDIRTKRLVPADLATSDALSPYQFGFYDVHANGGLDAVSAGSGALWAYRTSANRVRFGWLTQTGAIGGPGTGFSPPKLETAATASTGVLCISYSESADRVALMFWNNSASEVRARFYSGALTAFAFIAVQTLSTTEVERITSVPDPVDDDTFHVFAEVAGAEAYLDQVVYGKVNSSTIVTAVATLVRHAGLGSHAFQYGDGADEVLVQLVHDSTYQGTYFLVGIDGRPVGRILPGEANGRPVRAHLPRVSSPDDGVFQWAAAFKHRLNSAVKTDVPVYTQPGIKLVRYDFADTAAWSWVERNGCLLIGGGLVWAYDRAGLTEAGFLLYTENASAVASSAGSLTDNTTVSYRVYPEAYNSLGQRELGTIAAVVTIELGDGEDEVTLTIPSIAMTHRQGDLEFGFAVYRTAGDGTDYRRVSSLDPTTAGDINGWVANDPTVDTVTFVDRMSDTERGTKEPDYQNGDVSREVDNVAPPVLRGLRVVQGRVWGISAENPRRVFFSKLAVEKHAVEWFDGFYVDAPVEVTGIGVNQGRPILFGRESIYVIEGQGPDNINIGSYGEPELLPADVGVDEPRSLVEAPIGWMFKSRKGLRLLDRQFQLHYVGSDVAAYNEQDLSAATVVLDANHVRFLTSEGRTVVYDWERQEWTTWTRHEGVASVVWRGRYVFAKSDGTVRVENPGSFMEGNNAVAQGLTTSWIKTGPGPQGLGMVDKYVLYGKYKSACRLRIELGYDYEDHFRQSYEVDPAEFIETGTWGDDATWGDSVVWGGSGKTRVFRFRRQFKFRRASAIRFRITEIPGDDAGEGVELTALAIKVADMGGLPRLPESRSS